MILPKMQRAVLISRLGCFDENRTTLLHVRPSREIVVRSIRQVRDGGVSSVSRDNGNLDYSSLRAEYGKLSSNRPVKGGVKVDEPIHDLRQPAIHEQHVEHLLAVH